MASSADKASISAGENLTCKAVGKKAIRALFLVDASLIPARVVWTWCAAGHDIAEIWTDANPRYRGAWKRDRRLGRLAARWSMTAAIDSKRITHRGIENFKDAENFVGLINSLNVDVVLSVHFPRILPAALLSRLTMPVLNLHPSMLPAYRGATPLVSMVVDDAQDRFGGVTLHQIVPAIDAGPIYASRRVPFPKNKSLRRWEVDLARAASGLLVETVPQIIEGKIAGVAQSEEMATYRNTVLDDLKVTRSQSAEKISRLCETLGRVRPLMIEVEGRAYPITRLVRRLGRPTGQVPRVGWLFIDADVADARIRLRRKPVWEGRRRRIETRLLHILTR